MFFKFYAFQYSGTDYTISGTNELLSVPYALHAKAAGALAYTDSYALAPSDNATTIAPGSAVEFPNDGVISQGIERIGPGTFRLPHKGVYQVSFQVSVDQPGQLELSLNGLPLLYTVAGRGIGSSQIVGMAIIQTPFNESTLQLINPPTSDLALTITPYAGGNLSNSPVSAHLVITRLR